MRCNRCGGLMIYERFLGQEVEDFSGWRCVACGEIVDEVILKNRYKGLMAKMSMKYYFNSSELRPF